MDYKDKIEELVSDRKKFNEIIYTPVNEAVAELKKRWTDKNLKERIEKKLGKNIPKLYKKGSRMAICRDVYTPNFELHRFISAADALDLTPIFGEYKNDKFTSNNLSKYYLGKMGFHFGFGKNGGPKIKYLNIINFNEANGKPLSSVTTSCGQGLVDFHRELFFLRYSQFTKKHFFDISKWFTENGSSAKLFYDNFLTLFIRHGILFENFMLDKKELNFTRDYFLPAFFRVWDNTGKKPLIIALAPTEIEGDLFWFHYPPDILKHVENKLNNL